MKISRILFACCAAALGLTAVPGAHATNFTYYVTLNTAALGSDPNGPFDLDVSLIEGSGNVSNTVTLSNFIVQGGSFNSSGLFTLGSESGNFASSLTLTNSSPVSEYAQGFDSSVSLIDFKIVETTNSEVVGSGTPINDAFTVQIDDQNGDTDYYVATADPTDSDTLVDSQLFEDMTLSSVQTYNSTTPDAGVTAEVTTAAVPEPASMGLLALGAGALGLFANRFRRRA